jgi:nucleotide-binding universal stress UspA family protein
MGTVVVGVDGSETSRCALRWAARYAALTESTLDIVHVYSPKRALVPAFTPSTVATPAFLGTAAPVRQEVDRHIRRRTELSEAVHARAERMLDSALGEAGDAVRGLTVRRLAVVGHRPAACLAEHARGADALVVGSRGDGSRDGLRLGSVSRGCLNSATVPVVVVPPPTR